MEEKKHDKYIYVTKNHLQTVAFCVRSENYERFVE